ncbi:MAG: cation transporter [Candidatus Aenigmarchaeota archaeon]|nr:cation transporter [Candidatus Aenigmarchaeota archaeon]
MSEIATIAVSGLHCGSCEVVVRRALAKVPGVEKVSFTADTVTVDYQPGQATLETIARTIAAKGYRATAPGIDARPQRKGLAASFSGAFKDPALEAERETFQTGFITVIILMAAQAFILRGLFPAAGASASILTGYLIIAVAAVGASLWHLTSFRRQLSGMTGMMIGMTIGMVAGFLTGAVVGASNGIFIGTVYGVVAGMLVGSLAGKCCGIMGIMEGMMAGLMSGVMGGMVPLMFLSENVFLFLPILTGACLLILGGLAIHISWENKEYEKAHGKPVERRPFGFISFFSLCFIVIFLTTVLMVIGPKSALIQVI